MTREPALVARDVRRGYYTVAEAEEGFGVVLDPETFAIDEAATRALRGRSTTG
jgi:N-methylhydantoinase B